MLPLDDALVIELSFRGEHDGILLLGDVGESRSGKALGDMTDHLWEQLVWGEARKGADRVFHCLRSKTPPLKIQLRITFTNPQKWPRVNHT